MATTEHRVSFKLTYRPTLLSWIRPMLRGGPAFFMSEARAIDANGVVTMRVSPQSWGWVAGAGIDLYRQRGGGLRTTLVGTVQQVEQEFCDDAPVPSADAANDPNSWGSWQRASNIPFYKIQEMYRPICASGAYGYKLDTNAWQAGVMLADEF